MPSVTSSHRTVARAGRLLGGFIFFPWTTLIYGLAAPNGLSLLNIVLLAFGVLIDLGTWGVGFFASREKVSYYRRT